MASCNDVSLIEPFTEKSARGRSQGDHYGADIPLGSAETRKHGSRGQMEMLSDMISLADCTGARCRESAGEAEGTSTWSSTAICVRSHHSRMGYPDPDLSLGEAYPLLQD